MVGVDGLYVSISWFMTAYDNWGVRILRDKKPKTSPQYLSLLIKGLILMLRGMGISGISGSERFEALSGLGFVEFGS